MESILNIDLKNNPELLEDFDGISPGDLIKVEACFKVGELSRIDYPRLSMKCTI